MSVSVDDLLKSFRSLPEEKKHELASEILRWSREVEHPGLEGEELAAIADDVFRGLDDDEVTNG